MSLDAHASPTSRPSAENASTAIGPTRVSNGSSIWLATSRRRSPAARETLWDQRDVVLITYGRSGPRRRALSPWPRWRGSLAESGLDRVINTVHLLPCFPYSSDDGFSVIDYRRIDPALGDWSDVEALGRDHALMFDLVLNHVLAPRRVVRAVRGGGANPTRGTSSKSTRRPTCRRSPGLEAYRC